MFEKLRAADLDEFAEKFFDGEEVEIPKDWELQCSITRTKTAVDGIDFVEFGSMVYFVCTADQIENAIANFDFHVYYFDEYIQGKYQLVKVTDECAIRAVCDRINEEQTTDLTVFDCDDMFNTCLYYDEESGIKFVQRETGDKFIFDEDAFFCYKNRWFALMQLKTIEHTESGGLIEDGDEARMILEVLQSQEDEQFYAKILFDPYMSWKLLDHFGKNIEKLAESMDEADEDDSDSELVEQEIDVSEVSEIDADTDDRWAEFDSSKVESSSENKSTTKGKGKKDATKKTPARSNGKDITSADKMDNVLNDESVGKVRKFVKDGTTLTQIDLPMVDSETEVEIDGFLDEFDDESSQEFIDFENLTEDDIKTELEEFGDTEKEEELGGESKDGLENDLHKDLFATFMDDAEFDDDDEESIERMSQNVADDEADMIDNILLCSGGEMSAEKDGTVRNFVMTNYTVYKDGLFLILVEKMKGKNSPLAILGDSCVARVFKNQNGGYKMNLIEDEAVTKEIIESVDERLDETD